MIVNKAFQAVRYEGIIKDNMLLEKDGLAGYKMEQLPEQPVKAEEWKLLLLN
jgi:hypothetical protein